MLINCPYCGVRPVEEFTFNGDASLVRPTSNDPESLEQWYSFVYLRANPRGSFAEYAHHAGGCRAWLVLSRDTASHAVHNAVAARSHGKKGLAK